MKYAINWRWNPEARAFISKMHSSKRKPYTHDLKDPDTKFWTTVARAKLWLSMKDPTYASHCEIVPVND